MEHSELVTVERESIRDFVASHEFHGRVLDYGCGKAPYRDLVERTAEWHGFDRRDFPASTTPVDIGDERIVTTWEWDEILCTQVVQYLPDPGRYLRRLRQFTGATTLVLTYPTCWPEIETEDLWRFTRAGMEHLCAEADWRIDRHELRATINGFPLGYGLVAHAS